LISLERRGVLEATEERQPPHFHVAVFPSPYSGYVERVTGKPVRLTRSAETYVVKRGDTLWGIARRHETTVRQLVELNGLSTQAIRAGEKLKVPERAETRNDVR
jgi:LysM repeat protein